MNEVKPGVKTTEFYITIAFKILAIILIITQQVKPEIALIITGILDGFYVSGRTWVKKTKTTIDDKIIEEIGKILKKNK